MKRSPRLILTVLAFGVFVAADDLTVVSTMLRQIILDLEIPLPDGLDDAAWIVNAYLIAYVVVMPITGRISDILGRRAVFIASFALFLAGSIWVPFATTLPSFIFGRVLTALGGGAMVPVSMAIIADIYPPEKRPSALGILGAVDTAGWVWGPLYGALLVRYLSWQWQFYLNIPLSIIGIIAVWYALGDLPEVGDRGSGIGDQNELPTNDVAAAPSRATASQQLTANRQPPTANRQRLDWLGAITLTISLLTLNIALLNSSAIQSVTSLTELTNDTAQNTTLLYLIALVSFILFVYLQRRTPHLTPDTSHLTPRTPPLIDLTLFRLPNFSPAIIVNFLVGGVLIIAMVNVPLFINVVIIDLADAALASGRLLSYMTAAMAVMAYVGGKGTERWHARPVTLIGLLLCTIAFGLMGQSWQADTPDMTMALQLALLGIGFGLVTAPIGAVVIDAAPEGQRGIAASLVIVFRLMGMSVGLSALTAWGLYRFNILRTQVELPSITDPDFAAALEVGLVNTTVTVLAETFAISAGVMVVALLFALWLRQTDS